MNLLQTLFNNPLKLISDVDEEVRCPFCGRFTLYESSSTLNNCGYNTIDINIFSINHHDDCPIVTVQEMHPELVL